MRSPAQKCTSVTVRKCTTHARRSFPGFRPSSLFPAGSAIGESGTPCGSPTRHCLFAGGRIGGGDDPLAGQRPWRAICWRP
jgi:hypothetical protein